MQPDGQSKALVFQRRSETFGFDTSEPWALPALRLLYHAPRVFEPLAEAWERLFPGVKRSLTRLEDLGFVDHQPAVVVDMRNRSEAAEISRKVDRFRLSAAGRRLYRAAVDDQTVLRMAFPRLTDANVDGVMALFAEFDVDSTRAKHGRSMAHFAATGPLPRRTAYFWAEKLTADGLLRKLPDRARDAHDSIPEHWRVNRALSAQVLKVLTAYPEQWGFLRSEFQLRRSKYLSDIELSRVGVGGGTDYDHDISAQLTLALMLESSSVVLGSPVELEPHHRLTVDDTERPWKFSGSASNPVYYQPDAVLWSAAGSKTLNVVEYERLRSRRSAWSHIERFLGWLDQTSLPFEPARLLFVVDTERRERSYVELIEAFADYADEHPDRMPRNTVALCVSSRVRLADAADPLADTAWFRVTVPKGSGGGCVLHPQAVSPFNSYFDSEN